MQTPAVDADFALVASGIGGGRDRTGPLLDLASNGPGNLSISLGRAPAGYVDGFVFLSLTTSRPLAMGRWLGIEDDWLTYASLSNPATPGDPLHFSYTANPALFPNATYVVPAQYGQILRGFTLDGVALFMDATGNFPAASNVDRVTVQ
ncbi:MAG: hypothetical protein FJ265_03160 [Planctomycetes bacterium]|nr:hypothetical protein [Planctomycetota bacterium]